MMTKKERGRIAWEGATMGDKGDTGGNDDEKTRKARNDIIWPQNR